MVAGAVAFSSPIARGQNLEGNPPEPYCPAPEPEIPVLGLSFGSRAIVESCWTAQELAGRATDKLIRRTKTYLNPPLRLFPGNTIAALPAKLQNSIRDVTPDKNEKIAALTFDLCERANEITGYDSEIVNYLRANKIKATFFAGGKWMLDHPEKTMQLMADPLFEIGNHAWTHDDLRLERGIKMQDQILWPQAEYELLREQLKSKPCAQRAGEAEMKKIPKIPCLFRFPYGVCNSEALDFLAQTGLPAIQWSIVTADPSEKRTPEQIANRVVRSIKPGAIIICHANGRGKGTAKALPIFVPKLKKRGYEFVTVSELLTYGPVFATRDCYELKPGDNYNYDKIYGGSK